MTDGYVEVLKVTMQDGSVFRLTLYPAVLALICFAAGAVVGHFWL